MVPHPSTGHAHGCLASEIGRDPAFPTRFDRTVDSPEVSLLASSTTSPCSLEETVLSKEVGEKRFQEIEMKERDVKR